VIKTTAALNQPLGFSGIIAPQEEKLGMIARQERTRRVARRGHFDVRSFKCGRTEPTIKQPTIQQEQQASATLEKTNRNEKNLFCNTPHN
jgi:hypothetical protein